MLLRRMVGGARRLPYGIVLAFILAAVALVTPGSVAVSPARADSIPPKAVFIVGPTNDQTDGNLEDAEAMARQAEAAGMDVRRVFFPYATWDNVLANIQGASMVVYMGHGYGWPSPYTTKLTESRQNGMGLNSYPGSGRAEFTYYGANPIRNNIDLAPNSVVFNIHLCYAAGNGESGMAIPSDDLARERVDNFANGWLAAGAGAVFALSWGSHLNLPSQLMTSNQTMDQMFNIPANGSPMGHVGWRDLYYDSVRTPGARNHLDPHPSYGFYRAVSGNLNMTTADFRAGAMADATPPAPPPTDPSNPPQVTHLAPAVSQFHPNADGLADELVINHVVSRATYLDVAITNQAGETVRSYSIWATGTGATRWNGKNNAGTLVPDGSYTITYTPRDTGGVTGTPVAASVVVLRSVATLVPTKAQVFSADADALAKTTAFKLRVNQPVRLTWRIVNAAGETVRTYKDDVLTPAGTPSFVWDGKSSTGAHVPDGYYRSVVTAQTGLGSYTTERRVYVGAFVATPSTTQPAVGASFTVNLLSTEPLLRAPTVQITQPGVAPWTVTATHVNGRKYRINVSLSPSGQPGAVQLLVRATDKNGGTQSSLVSVGS